MTRTQKRLLWYSHLIGDLPAKDLNLQTKPSSDQNRQTSNRVLSSRSRLKPGAGLLSLWARHRPTSGAGQSLKQVAGSTKI
ncbi:hypothetical protein RRG08_050174 [Elysia crispata]|uniref:Uncharacterized protein n=1 Tax=Elysia crispata TaxID=231223 RepID=A0AAE0ZUM8_9GAST|nr:hypothetical protein RRG08_050174 [Elysia crispata]